MGRDRHDRVSQANYQDVRNMLRDLEEKHDTITAIQVLTDPEGKGLFVNASCTIWATPTQRKDFVVSLYAGMNTPPLTSVMYQAATRLWHQVDAWIERGPRRLRLDH